MNWQITFPNPQKLLVLLAGVLLILAFQPVLADKPDEINDKLNAKFETLNESLTDLVDQAVIENPDMFTPAQRDHMRNTRGRANRSRERIHEAGGLKRMGRKAKLECVINELFGDGSGNDDGICEKGEICEEQLGDQIGDEDGECEWKFCGKKELCAENCNEEAIDEVVDNYDTEAINDIEESMNDVTIVLDDASIMLQARAQRMAVIGEIQTVTDLGDKCALLPVSRQRNRSYAELQAIFAAANSTEMAYNICDSACNQDAFGFNCSAVCAVLAGAAGVVKIIAEASELQDDTVTSEQVDAANECIKQLGEEIDGIQEQLGDLNEMIEERFNEVVELLNTPQGKRPDFPEK